MRKEKYDDSSPLSIPLSVDGFKGILLIRIILSFSISKELRLHTLLSNLLSTDNSVYIFCYNYIDFKSQVNLNSFIIIETKGSEVVVVQVPIWL